MGKSSGDKFAAQSDLDVVDDGSWRKVKEIGQIDARFEIHIVDHAGGGIMEMAVFAEIRTVAGGFALEIYLPNDAVLDERFEAVVNGGQRDVRQAVLDPHEDINRGRMVPLLHERAVNLLALARHAEPGDFLGDLDFG